MPKHLFTATFLLVCLNNASFAQNLVNVKDINNLPGGNSNPYGFTVSNNKLFFIANDGINYNTLWVTEGNDASTKLIGPTNGVPNSILNPAAYNNKVYFTYDSHDDGLFGSELWVSDGTAAGTVLFKDLNPGISRSAPQAFTVANNKLFFVAGNIDGDLRLWVTDGTLAGTKVIKNTSINLFNGAAGFAVLNNEIYFTSDNGTGSGYGLWKSDGTSAGTVLVRPDVIAVTTSNYAVMNAKLYLMVSDYTYGSELWVTDGSLAGTHIVKNLSADGGGVFGNGNPQNLKVYNNLLYFAGRDDTHGMELFVTDGTEPGTHIVKDIVPGFNGSDPFQSVIYNGFLYFISWQTQELWKTDGSEAGTVLVKSTMPSYSRFAATWNGKMYLLNGLDAYIWESDGTAAGTMPVKVQNTGYTIYGYSAGAGFTEYNAELYFNGYCYLITNGYELCKLTTALLPMHLISFTGEVQKDKDVLKWTTTNEINFDHFNVEQSNNGSVFKPVAKVNTASDNLVTRTYNYTQPAAVNPAGYYRLQMVNKDGSFSYSPIIKLNHESGYGITANYIPGTKKIIINNNTQSRCNWQLISINGSLIKQGVSSDPVLNISVSNVATGTYIVLCKYLNETRSIKVFVN